MPYDNCCPSCGKVNGADAKFCSECGSPLTAYAKSPADRPGSTPAAVRLRSGPAAERRLLTIMFCDLVDSTALVSRIDAEEMREVYRSSLKLVSELATKSGGFVAQGFGDGALVYFGFPQAHENDAELAIGAAMEILEAANELVLLDNYRPRFRIGIATGHVVIGETIQAEGVIEFDVTGEPPNLAARLQALAEPGTIIISSETRRVAGGLFKYRDLGRLNLKGFAHPVQGFEVLGRAATESRFEALRGAVASQLFGREEQIEFLMQRWKRAKNKQGQVVLLSGEPGIGKSRLAMMLFQRLENEPQARLRYYCSPIHQGSPFHPIITQIERVAHITRDDSATRKLEKLKQLLTPGAAREEDVTLIADLLSMIPEGSNLRLPSAPQRRRAKTIEALLHQLRAMAAQQPLLLLFEDAHWSDPSTLELLDLLIQRIPSLRALLIVTSRPEFVHHWTKAGVGDSEPYVSELVLTPLAKDHCVQLIEAVAGRGALFPGVIRKIIERADGIPLFLEELTQAVVETDKDQSAGSAVHGGAGGVDVPMTLHGSLMARLERLSDGKAVMQIGAAIGREFSYELLSAVAEKPQWELTAALEQLSESGLLQRRGTGRDTAYVFKHALLQEAAYASILRHMRPKLHRRIFEVLKRDFPETERLRPNILAHHCSEARMVEEAVGYWLKAGQYALSRSANLEAVDWLRRGLDLVGELPEGELRSRLELDLCVVLTKAFFTMTGYTSRETIEMVERARRVCDRLGQPSQLSGVLNGQWVSAFIGNDLLVAERHAEEMLALGAATKNPVLSVLGYRCAGLNGFARGEFLKARENLERGLALYDPAHAPIYGLVALEDVQVLMLTYLSYVLVYLGSFDQARVIREKAFVRARAVGQAHSMAHAYNALALTELLLRNPESALKAVDELEKLNEEHALFYYRAFAVIFRGWALADLGQPQEGIPLMERGLMIHRASGARLYEAEIRRWLAAACLRGGRHQEGLDQLKEASSIQTTTESYGDEGEVHRIRAEILAALGDDAEAEKSFYAALEAAERRSSGLWRLRAATGLARLLERQGEIETARVQLKNAYGRVTEGFDTPDVREAKAVLDQLT